MKLKLRPREYQQRIVDDVMRELKPMNPLVVQAGTASGKSLMIAMVADRIGGKVLVLQPSVELLRQNAEKMSIYTDDIGVYSASAGSKIKGQVTMATLGSVKDVDFSDYDTLLIDEADSGYPTDNAKSMFMKFVNKNAFKYVVGFTATPYKLQAKVDWSTGRSKQKISMLTRIPTKGTSPSGYNRYGTFFWKKIVGKIESYELLEAGYITPVEYFTEKPQYGSKLVVNSTGNDYTKESMEEFGDAIVSRAAEVVVAVLTKHKNTLVFMPSVDSAERLAKVLEGANLKYDIDLTPSVVHGGSKKAERVKAIEDFKSGKCKVLINVAVLLAGFDYPELDSVVNARPTLSVRTWVQQVGRLQRIADGKQAGYMYDISGTALTFGQAENIRLAKEGIKDALVCAKGRLDETILAEYDINTTPKAPKLKLSNSSKDDNDGFWANL